MLLAVLLAAHGDGVVVVRLRLVGYAVVGGNAAAVVVALYAVVVTLGHAVRCDGCAVRCGGYAVSSGGYAVRFGGHGVSLSRWS